MSLRLKYSWANMRLYPIHTCPLCFQVKVAWDFDSQLLWTACRRVYSSKRMMHDHIRVKLIHTTSQLNSNQSQMLVASLTNPGSQSSIMINKQTHHTSWCLLWNSGWTFQVSLLKKCSSLVPRQNWHQQPLSSCQAKWPLQAKHMSSNIQLPKIATSVSFCDSKEALLIPPTPPGAGAGAGADTPLLDVPDSAREAIRASSSLALMLLAALLKEILRCWSQLATMFQGHCTRADLQQSLSTPLLLFSKLWEATPRPELPQPSSSSNCRRGQSDFQLRPEISSEHLRASKPMFKI